MIQEAGLINLIKTIAIFFAVYYSFKFVARYILPWLLKRFINKQQEKFNQQQGYSASGKTTNEGEVKITSATKKTTSKDQLGDYVDYEEITDDK